MRHRHTGALAVLALSCSALPISGQLPDASVTDTLDSSVRVVVIDAGHGGNDPGTIGISGVREKDVALAVAKELAIILGQDPGIEVHLTRDDDRYLYPWKRGEVAMGFKGNRSGLFLSIHANAMPGDSVTRGFEVFFLNEARTEHERRVAAIENAPPPAEGVAYRIAEDPELDGILRELLNIDAHRWSSILAESVRDGMATAPNTRDRGVRQGPLAVITNTLMPGVLIELGYLTNRTEEHRLTTASHQADLAWGIAQGVYSFFAQYPPAQSAVLSDRDPGPAGDPPGEE
ncbi:MAG: N-acetylmuramoyl-L-alanine amidase family protein [Longimicrobiales bacterium]